MHGNLSLLLRMNMKNELGTVEITIPTKERLELTLSSKYYCKMWYRTAREVYR